MESARASFDWLQEEGPALPSRLQNSVSERIVPKLQRREKKDGAVHIGLFQEKLCPAYATRCLHLCNSFILHTETYSSE